jgi:hypothetical protein
MKLSARQKYDYRDLDRDEDWACPLARPAANWAIRSSKERALTRHSRWLVLGSPVECLIEGNEVNPAPETERVVPNLWLVIEGEPEFRHRLKSEKLSVEESSGDGVAPSESFDPRLVKSLRLARLHSGHESLAD